MKRPGIFLLLLFILSSAAPFDNDPEKVYRDNGLTEPGTMLRELFRKNEIIFLGENHRIRQQVRFVGTILPALQKQGVHILFSEFANYSDTRLSDSILTAPVYNERLVYGLLQRCEWDWAWQEYADIYRAAWKVNHQRLPGELPFRIIGLQPDLNYTAIREPGDWDDPDKISAYWNYANNKTWTEIIEAEAILNNLKALVHCGWHHAFSKFNHPIVVAGKFVRFEKDREGTAVLNKYPGKVATVLLYNALPAKPLLDGDMIRPFGGMVDSLAAALPPERRTFGFLTQESPPGGLADSMTFYSMGYGRILLKDLCDAMIVTGRVCDYESATFIDGFIDDSNFENSRIQAFPYSFSNDWTVRSMNDSLRAWHKDNLRYIQKIRKTCDGVNKP